MKVYVGGTSSRRIVALLKDRGMGRVMTPDCVFIPYKGEPWIADNGAYGCWRRGDPFNEVAFLRMVARAEAEWHPPEFGVLPDIVAGGLESLDFSLSWLDRLPPWRWYLAVQDGMTQEDVRPLLDRVAGLFIGGTLRFKGTSAQWVGLGLPVHFGRAGVLSRLDFADRAGCASADSAFPLWTNERLDEFLGWLDGLGNYNPSSMAQEVLF